MRSCTVVHIVKSHTYGRACMHPIKHTGKKRNQHDRRGKGVRTLQGGPWGVGQMSLTSARAPNSLVQICFLSLVVMNYHSCCKRWISLSSSSALVATDLFALQCIFHSGRVFRLRFSPSSCVVSQLSVSSSIILFMKILDGSLRRFLLNRVHCIEQMLACHERAIASIVGVLTVQSIEWWAEIDFKIMILPVYMYIVHVVYELYIRLKKMASFAKRRLANHPAPRVARTCLYLNENT